MNHAAVLYATREGHTEKIVEHVASSLRDHHMDVDVYAADVRMMLDTFVQDTGWKPARMKPVAGALRYSRYNFLIRFIMKRIARKAGAATDTSRDYEYTDWAALDAFVNELPRPE